MTTYLILPQLGRPLRSSFTGIFQHSPFFGRGLGIRGNFFPLPRAILVGQKTKGGDSSSSPSLLLRTLHPGKGIFAAEGDSTLFPYVCPRDICIFPSSGYKGPFQQFLGGDSLTFRSFSNTLRGASHSRDLSAFFLRSLLICMSSFFFFGGWFRPSEQWRMGPILTGALTPWPFFKSPRLPPGCLPIYVCPGGASPMWRRGTPKRGWFSATLAGFFGDERRVGSGAASERRRATNDSDRRLSVEADRRHRRYTKAARPHTTRARRKGRSN